MDLIELMKGIKEVGIPIGAFTLCAWIVVFIVKRLAGVIDKLSSKMDVFTTKVRDEHDRLFEQHKQIMKQHEGMIETLGRINGYKIQGG
tara:strand:+ start:171 stop:437 length:267 start_codon:yes stop_codon:yes gene_type:complete